MEKLEKTHPVIHEQFLKGYHVMRRTDKDFAGLSMDLAIEQELMRSFKTSGGLTRGGFRGGLLDARRQQWILSMPVCSSMNKAMQLLTGIQYISGEQHQELGESRKTRDFEDTLLMVKFLSERNPFEGGVLRNITTGEVASNEVNVDNSELLGEAILETLVGENVYSFSFKRKDTAITMATKVSMRTEKDEVQLDPNLLFQRLVALSVDESDKRDMFSHELCSFSASLFESPVLPRLPNKAVLADYLWNLMNDNNLIVDLSLESHSFVIDGGALLHKIPWPTGKTYNDLCLLYCSYLQRKYGNPTVVFDGYESGPDIKDVTHMRRKSKVTQTIVFEPDMVFTGKKDDFLGNEENKQRFINLLSQHIKSLCMNVLHAPSDADTLIVKTALNSAKTQDTCIIGDDTDLLILSLDGIVKEGQELKKLFLRNESKRSSKKQERTWILQSLSEILGEKSKHLLFAHAFLGCDTTSHVYGYGKQQTLKMLENEDFKKAAQVFTLRNVSKEEIHQATEECFLILYKAPPGVKTLDELRYIKFIEKVAVKGTAVLPQTLPPTSNAARYHGCRVYFQVMKWAGFDGLLPEEWGWKIKDNKLFPVVSDKPPAPQKLLEIIHCNCKGQCNRNQCSCRKHGLYCSLACGKCKGVSCDNHEDIDLSLEDLSE